MIAARLIQATLLILSAAVIPAFVAMVLGLAHVLPIDSVIPWAIPILFASPFVIMALGLSTLAAIFGARLLCKITR
jgi:hypothetical protein